MKIDCLVIDIERIPLEGLEINQDIEAEKISSILAIDKDLEVPVLASPLQLMLRLKINDKRLIIEGTFDIKVEIPCDRCLTDTQTVISSKINETLDLLASGLNTDLNEDERDDFLEIVNGRVNLSPLLSEYFWLAWPCYFICNEGCAGLCSHCGADLNQGFCSCSKQ